MKKRKVIVVGAGAAGMMAAGQAALEGADTLLLEKMRRPGLKLAITGKGRCNLTNIAEIPEFIAHFGKNGRFLRQAFHRFFNNDLTNFFESQGLSLTKERGGRVFPTSGKAQQVVNLFVRWLKECGVRTEHDCAVTSLLVSDGRICGVVVSGKREIMADAVILATGGACYPATGSTGDGYPMTEKLGHSIVAVRPALVPLETAGSVAGKMAELNLRNIAVRMLVDGKKKAEAFGELVFSTFGVTGPVILTLSGVAVDALREKKRVELVVDLKPALDDKKLDARLLRDFAKRDKEELNSILRGLLPREMVAVCLEMTGVSGNQLGNSVSVAERKKLRVWLKNLHLTVIGHRPIKEAIVTAGGVTVKEVDPRSMESRMVKGLYLVGELLDLQADTGGYNLQAAFSTGWLAGRCAASQPVSLIEEE
ncbi:MAG: NAD(P)/FAD-dependent oxidoreductase [Thermodesulfobacteriota bacterium]|nr:NAD(P)/FAD-dependent oxidoreductase [Thermodesulfobacteriota bacterium]